VIRNEVGTPLLQPATSTPPLHLMPTRLIKQQAAALLALHVFRADWTIRRFDITTLDHGQHMRWQTRWEVRLPAAFSVRAVDHLLDLPELPLPIVVRARSLATGFHLTDDLQRPVTTLTWGESTPIVVEMLHSLARETVRATGDHYLDRAVGDCLRGFAGSDDDARGAMASLRAYVDGQPGRRARQSSTLLADPLLRGLLVELAAGYYVIAMVRLPRGEVRSFNLSHEEYVGTDGISLQAGTAPSYHAEVRLPRGLRFRAEVKIAVEGEAGLFVRHELREDLLAFYARPTYASARITVAVIDAVREAPWGFADKTWGVSLVTAGLFVLGFFFRIRGAVPEPGAAALVIALPTAYAAILLQDARSELEDRLRRGSRRVLVLVAATTFAGALTLATRFTAIPGDVPIAASFHLGWGTLIWLVAGTIAVLLALVTTVDKLRRS
jgi:hypothetical protein